jgi:hypothetical protein
VSIVEGDIPGQGPGYSVHIGSEPENTFRRYKQLGIMADGDLLVTISRINRMATPGSGALAMFRDAYRASKIYYLAPVIVDRAGTNILKPIFDLAIYKNQIHFRHVTEIAAWGDPDAPVLKASFE